MSTRPAGLPHPWGAISCRKATPLTTIAGLVCPQVDFVIQVTSEEQMDDMVNAVKSPEVVASMLTPMVDKGYGEASLMAETLRVVILLSPPPPPELGTDTMAPPALNSAPPFNTAYADNAAAPLSNAVSALLLAALVMMALL